VDAEGSVSTSYGDPFVPLILAYLIDRHQKLSALASIQKACAGYFNA
jgi:hypothetical protein